MSSLKKILSSFYNKLRFGLSSNNNFLFIGFYRYLYLPRKGSLSHLLSKYSTDIGSGFTVVQVGANDGITHDPIHKFIKRDNWRGVLLEPQKYVFERYLKKLYHKNTDIHVLNAAMGEKNGITHLYKIGFSNKRWATGLASFKKEVLQKAFASGYVANCAEKEGVNIPVEPEQQIVSEEVEMISVDKLMSQFALEKIDLLQVDTEGYDSEIIRMFRIDEIRPGLIIFEHSHLSEEEIKKCNTLLLNNGYAIKSEGANTVAMLKPSKKFEVFFHSE